MSYWSLSSMRNQSSPLYLYWSISYSEDGRKYFISDWVDVHRIGIIQCICYHWIELNPFCCFFSPFPSILLCFGWTVLLTQRIWSRKGYRILIPIHTDVIVFWVIRWIAFHFFILVLLLLFPWSTNDSMMSSYTYSWELWSSSFRVVNYIDIQMCLYKEMNEEIWLV